MTFEFSSPKVHGAKGGVCLEALGLTPSYSCSLLTPARPSRGG